MVEGVEMMGMMGMRGSQKPRICGSKTSFSWVQSSCLNTRVHLHLFVAHMPWYSGSATSVEMKCDYKGAVQVNLDQIIRFFESWHKAVQGMNHTFDSHSENLYFPSFTASHTHPCHCFEYSHHVIHYMECEGTRIMLNNILMNDK